MLTLGDLGADVGNQSRKMMVWEWKDNSRKVSPASETTVGETPSKNLIVAVEES